MPDPAAFDIIEQFKFHNWLIHNLVDGLTHEESILQLPFDSNCLNWVLGHIITNRSHVLEVAGENHAWRDPLRSLYHTGTAPIKPGSHAIQLDVLMRNLDESLELLGGALENVGGKWLDEKFTNYRGEKTRKDHLSGFHWHEAYHIGQLEIFKDLALANRKAG